MVKVIPFPGRLSERQSPPLRSLPPPFTREWQSEHLPLIDAAMDLLKADDAEFSRRCQEIEKAEGRSVLDALSAQLERLGSQVDDVVEALAMTAMRIRTTIALSPA